MATNYILLSLLFCLTRSIKYKNPSVIPTFVYKSYPPIEVGYDPSCVSMGVSGVPCSPIFSYDENDACPTTLGITHVELVSTTSGSISALGIQISNAKNLIDGGNTTHLINYEEDSTNQEAKQAKIFCKFHKKLFKITSKTGSFFEMSDKNRDYLHEIAEDEKKNDIVAEAILNFVDYNTYHLDGKDYVLPGNPRMHEAETGPDPITEQGNVQMNLYPNPANQNVTVQLINSGQMGKIALFDIYGRSILSLPLSNNQVIINVSDLANGIYHVVYTDKNETLSKKLVVSK